MNKKNLCIFIVSISFFFVNLPIAYPLDFHIVGSISETYDDNITNTEDKEDDYITNIALGVLLSHTAKTQVISLGANLYQHLYVYHDDLDFNSQDLTLAYTNELSGFDRIQINEIFQHYPEPRSFADSFGSSYGRVGYYRNNVNIAYSREWTRQLRSNLRYMNIYNGYLSGDISDSVTNSSGLTFDYYLDSGFMFALFYDFFHIRFESGESSMVNTAGAGIRYNFTTNLYIDVRGGYDFLDLYDDKTYPKPFVNGAIVYVKADFFTLSVNGNKRYSISYNNASMFDQWRVAADFSMQIQVRSVFTASVFYGEGSYVGTEQSDSFLGAMSSYTFRYSEQLEASLRYSYTLRTASNTGIEETFDRHAVTISATGRY